MITRDRIRDPIIRLRPRAQALRFLKRTPRRQ